MFIEKTTMSIATKTGDLGETGLMYNRRVSKCAPRVEAYGTVDELNAAIGIARASASSPFVRETLLAIQADLVAMMGDLATSPEDLARYTRDGYAVIAPSTTTKLDEAVRVIEAQKISFKGWATPGADIASAALDLARTVCRRSERRVCALREHGQLHNSELIVYLNRLSDVLWLLARWTETQLPPA